MQIVAVYRLHPVFSLLRHLHASGIGHCQDGSRFPLQVFIVFDFQSHKSLVISAGKAKHLGGQAVVWIVPFVILIHLHPRQVVRSDLIAQGFVHIGLNNLPGTVLFHLFSDSIFLDSQFFA